MKDITLEETRYFTFTTRAFATGIPTTLAGTPVISAYEDDSVTQITAGITLGVDHDSVTGFNLITVAATAANGYESGKDYSLTITTGTVGGVSVVGEVVGEFSIESSAAAVDLANSTDGLTAIYSAIGNIGSASGGALNFANEADNVDAPIKSITFDGVETSGTNASVNAEDGTYHQIDDTANNIDIVYQFDVGGGRTGVELTWKGYLSGVSNSASIQVYNGSGWDVVGTISGKAGSTNDTLTIPLLATHTGTSTDLGKVYVRLECASQTNPTLYTDQLLAAAVSIGQSVGYEGGAVWVDGSASNTNTENFVDGVADNPVSTLAAAKTIADSVGLKVFHFLPGTSETLAATYDSYKFTGAGYSIALGGQSIEGATFDNADITGIGTATVTQPTLNNCHLGAVTMPPSVFHTCGIGQDAGQFTAGSAGEYVFHECYSLRAGAASPVFVFTGLAATTGINNRAWNGGATYTLDSDCTLSHEVAQGGATTITTGGGDAEIRGITRALTVTASAAETVQFVGVTGPITLNGTTTATVNLYGVTAGVTDNTSAATVTDNTVWGSITTAGANKLADHTIRRTQANARASSDGDTVDDRSLLGSLSTVNNKVSTTANAGKLTVYEEDDSTEFVLRTITTNASADPITIIDPP
jgi:hypothetical protein